jgi:hypothetical protein
VRCALRVGKDLYLFFLNLDTMINFCDGQGYINKNKMNISCSIMPSATRLTAHEPGTPYQHHLKLERIPLDFDCDFSNCDNVVFQPAVLMSLSFFFLQM